MDIEHILEELTHYERLPVEAMHVAAANKEAVVPRFIKSFEDYVDGRDREGASNLLFLAFHLLGEWREKSAYRPLAHFLRCPSEDVGHVLGDSTTETSHRVMAAVFDGDPQPLYDVILDRHADEYLRARMCGALAMVTVRGALPREEAARFLRACFTDLEPKLDCFVWDGWQGAVSMLGLQELQPLVKHAFDEEWISPAWLSYADFEEDLAWALAHPRSPHQRFESEFALWGDTAAAMSSWYCFSEKYFADEKRWASQPAKSTGLPHATVNVDGHGSRTEQMDIDRILDELTHCDRLPVAAMRAADDNKEAVVPRFKETFADYAAGKNRNETADLLLIAFHLLGEWREKSAYRLMAQFLRCPSEDVEYVLTDGTIANSHRVMAAVFDGDPQPLYDVILDTGAHECARASMFEALAMVTLRGELPREEAARFLRACFSELQPQQECYAWVGWQSAIALLGLKELEPLVKQAFDRGFIAADVMGYEHFEEDLEWGVDFPDSPSPRMESDYQLWDYTISELSALNRFDVPDSNGGRLDDLLDPSWFQRPAVNINRHVGRNDPCPCGSGKKFKKCCLKLTAA